MKHAILSIMAVSILTIAGCGPGRVSENQVTFEDIDGVTYVHNPSVPLHPDKSLEYVEELSIGGEDEDGNVILFQPGRFLVDDLGRIFITEMQDQVFKVFDPAGRLINTIGAKGDGPGEFQSIAFSGFTPDGRLLVTDFQARRTSFFDADGKFLEAFKWTRFFSILHLIKSGSYLTQEFIYEGDGSDSQLFIKEIDFAGHEVRSYGEFTPPETKAVHLGNMMFGTSIPYSPRSVFAGDAARELLYHCLSSEYRIEVFDAEGSLIRVMDRPYTLPPFTAEEQREFRERYKDNPNEQYRKLMQELDLPDQKNVTEQMLVDSEGNLWVFTHETREDSGKELTAFDVFDPEGRYDARVWLEAPPQCIKDGKIYVQIRDEETGYMSLKRFRYAWVRR